MRADAVRTITRPAMGAEVAVTTDASDIAVQTALTVVATLDRRWSRFRDDSKLSRINTADGPAVARPSTDRIIEVALAGRTLTDGWYDPTLGQAIAAAGYRHDHAAGWADEIDPVPGGPASVDGDTGLVHVPAGTSIDLGGIAKGWAADLGATLLADTGALHAGVAVGGDLRVRSRTRAVVEIEPPGAEFADAPILVGMRDGGVAVSGPTKRRAEDGRLHLIDPTTGRPAADPRVAVVIAASAAGAEMLATAASIAPVHAARTILERAGATAWLVERGGELTTIGTPERFLLDDGWLAEPARREWAL
ncbi:MAG: FAD:protein FMN transferase [Acidimicrobiales bacterium]|nr:FAD:protein FMN transferase [Acidimicrobiales bacterium]